MHVTGLEDRIELTAGGRKAPVRAIGGASAGRNGQEPRMKSDADLRRTLERIDKKGYKAYKEIEGGYDFARYLLFIDHVQGDPFASPSRLRVRVERKTSGFLPDTTSSRSRTTALRDFLTRRFFEACKTFSRGNRGTGKSGLITIDRPGQEILERSSAVVTDDFVEARFWAGLPARGRRISGKDARAMLLKELPDIVENALFASRIDKRELYRHIELAEDADVLRGNLPEMGLVAFISDGALLPRASGIDPRPLDEGKAVRFLSPPEYRVDVDLPNRGNVSGMGIPKGVTLIVGGGYHGKSTVLNAVEVGIYNHIDKDGRELCVTGDRAVKIRAADGRNIEKTDISPFINNLPLSKDTTAFSTQNASGSTSQAANISEALEAGAEVLLLDEDTSATNFMIRDHRMQQLVSKDREPITPFVDKVRQLYADKGVSTILVMGGSGDYFSVADHVIQLADYKPADVTGRAHEISRHSPGDRVSEGGDRFGDIRSRFPLSASFDPYRGNRRLKVAAKGLREILFGRTTIDLLDVEQLVDTSQTHAIAHAIHYAMQYMNGKRSMKEVVTRVIDDVERQGLDILAPYKVGNLAGFRAIDLAAAINRMRTLEVRGGP